MFRGLSQLNRKHTHTQKIVLMAEAVNIPGLINRAERRCSTLSAKEGHSKIGTFCLVSCKNVEGLRLGLKAQLRVGLRLKVRAIFAMVRMGERS